MSGLALGLIARCDSRGIAHQTEEFFRHMKPDKTLVVRFDDPAWPEDPQRFHGRNVAHTASHIRHRRLTQRHVRDFVDGLDVVFTVETVYDWRLIDCAREAGARVVIQGNPEFYIHHRHPEWDGPDRWVWPTPWMLDHPDIPDGTILPVPCVRRPVTAASPQGDGPLRILHVAGHAAAGDRNGTIDFCEAVGALSTRVHVTIIGQDGILPAIRPRPNVTVETIPNGVEGRWSMYHDQHLVVLPRKYGGLSLPALEAMSCGCAIIMPDTSPNEIWPGPRIPARKGRLHRSPFGHIETVGVHPVQLASEIDRLNRDRDALAAEMARAQRFADLNSWDDLGPLLYRPLLEEM